ncbi:HlyD family type I secretion periplasmic adaptor subunit [Brevundimonas sp. PAMC22021]|uniref:HlyD family type I secretion periplasmic adaptor subunit n=1 Tax=Brevundimonas sp. PAMC22021 TaxID=2861285 RepID=UPI001C631DA5|nr:HlyD family type I secretion periplasmic adaptor subunit [Brevundimonas sp. PAMC22021]QYF87821.1 HlyD family type I secretion periplasmic adaptor subunit [Brevundimonas sp. PAMC22021]
MTQTLDPPGGVSASDDQLDSPRRDLIIGGVLIALFFGLFLGWAAFAPLDAGAYASGQVAVSGNRQAVQHREGGTVSRLHVAEGDRVQRGQVLVELNTGELRAVERGLTGQVLSLLAQRARMIAERDRLGAIPIPAEFAGLSAEDRALADEALRLQRLQFGARRSGRSTETGVLQQRIGQVDQQIEGYQRQIESNIAQRRLIEEELVGMRELAAKGFAPQNRVRALERTAASLDGELGALRAQVASAREAVGETRLEMLGVSTKMNEDVADTLRQLEVQLNELRPRLEEARRQIARSQIRSPSTGQVVGLTVFTPGGVIQPGQTLMDVVPDEASQVIVAQVNPADIDNLRIGQETEVKFPGLRERSIPILHGQVTRISADSFVDEATGRSHYRAEVVVPPAELERLGAKARQIRPGMPAEVVVLLRKRTALAYLTEPLTSSLWRTGSEQ